MNNDEETQIFQIPNLQELMKWTNKQLLMELRKRAKPIAIEHGLSIEAMNDLVKKSFQDIQRIRHRIH